MKRKNKGKYYSGTSGLVLPIPKRLFAPEHEDKSRLAYYATLFNSIEINSSFYKVPMPKTVEKWAGDVPPDFRFTYKLWKEVTHNKDLAFDEQAIGHFMEVIDRAGGKKGCLLIQFPPKFTIAKAAHLEKILQFIRQADPRHSWNVAVEFRNPSLYHRHIDDMLERYGAGMVLHDMQGSAPPELEDTAAFVYLRFHGTEKGYRGSYTDDFLHEYAGYINEWRKKGKDVYAYFNNTMGSALANLQTLDKYVGNK